MYGVPVKLIVPVRSVSYVWWDCVIYRGMIYIRRCPLTSSPYQGQILLNHRLSITSSRKEKQSLVQFPIWRLDVSIPCLLQTYHSQVRSVVPLRWSPQIYQSLLRKTIATIGGQRQEEVRRLDNRLWGNMQEYETVGGFACWHDLSLSVHTSKISIA
jgi:hypothetical protein